MTIENVSGGTALVSPAAGSACLNPQQQRRSLRSGASGKDSAVGPDVVASLEVFAGAPGADFLSEEAAFVHEEEKMMEDEEITSDEEVHGHGVGKGIHDDSSPHRYGLRKRRRPSGQDLERLEDLQSSKDGGLARVKSPIHDEISVDHVAVSQQSPTRQRNRKARLPSPQPPPLPQIFSTSVPNPLRTTHSPVQHSHHSSALLPYVTVAEVPCPLPLPSSSPEPPQLESADKRNVTFDESAVSTGRRIRGFSIDIDLGMDCFPDDNNSDAPSVASRRDRAFSFECFAFGINADEPLPPLEQSSSSATPAHHLSSCSNQVVVVGGRPRGDSIIFDPVSFQEGGIHEQNALEKTLADVSTSAEVSFEPAPMQPEEVPSHECPEVTPTPPAAVVPLKTEEVEEEEEDAKSSDLPVRSIPASASSTAAASVSLDLVNKDGRIGIYLPDARRARIARFHAKRSRRIWRKRIKYDCRKKLADSRPRIKGRFVKRSEMED